MEQKHIDRAHTWWWNCPSLAGCSAIALWLVVSVPCFGVIVYEKGKAEPIHGYLISEDSIRIVVREITADGKLIERALLKTEITELTKAVEEDRLSALTRDKPQSYRDYAEELTVKRKDPDARVTAIRLYLIAAYLDPEKLGRSSLLGMIALARSPEEASRFRAAAYLLDPDHDRSVLKQTATTTNGPDLSAISAGDKKLLQALLRSLREGDWSGARVAARRPALKTPMEAIKPFLSIDDLSDVSITSRTPLPPDVLRKILKLELLLSGRPIPEPEDSAGADNPGSWSSLDAPTGTGPIPQLSLETLTEFDPRNCHFRDGKWVP